MSVMSTVLTADNSTLHSQIGSKVCQAIIAIQVQQPELLLGKYRDIPWQSSRHQSGLVNKLTEILGQTQDEKLTQQLLQKFLRALLSPESFSSPIIINLFKEVSQLGSSKIDGNGASTSKISESESESETNLNELIKSAPETEKLTNNAPQAAIVDQETQENVDTTKDTSESNTLESNTSETTNNTPGAIDDNTNNAAYTQGGVAVLLLDAENLQFNNETEKFLSSVCNYPIQVKVAFANWCRKGKLDAELHARNYD